MPTSSLRLAWEVDIGINWGEQTSSEGGNHVSVPAHNRYPARWPDFPFFSREAENLDFFMKHLHF